MSAPRHSISACLIVEDEREVLPAALASVAFCDEVVVVDSGSTDGTQALARAAGAQVVQNPWPGFGAQRNVAVDHATGDWILEVDADERITPALAREIEAFLSSPGARDEVDVLALPMRHEFLGAPLSAAAQYPNYRTRMFRRGAYRHDEGRTVHEGIKPRGTTHAMHGDMIHLLASSWKEAFGDVWRYTRLEASTFAPPVTARTAAVGVVARPAAKAGYRLLVDGAWRDGWRGWVKVGLDAGSDAVIWGRVLARHVRGGDAPSPRAGQTHFGEVMPPAGPLRVVALAGTPQGAVVAAAWLEAAIDAGAGTDSELVAPPSAGAPTGRFASRPADGRGAVSFARALLGSVQVRTVDAILLADPGARRAHRGLAGTVRGTAAPVGPSDAPAETVARLTAALRPT